MSCKKWCWVVLCMAANALFQGALADDSLQDEHRQILDSLERFIAENGKLGNGMITGCREYRLILEQGPSYLALLAERMESTGDQMVKMTYGNLFRVISQFSSYPYSHDHLIQNGWDLYDSDPATLPFLSHNFAKGGPNMRESQEKLTAWWNKRDQFPSVEIRIKRMRELLKMPGPDNETLSQEDYRRFQRELGGYGIFNLPAYITLIREDNNCAAFAQLLQVARRPEYGSGNPVEIIKRLSASYPTREERMTLMKAWWAEQRPFYFAGLPQLFKEIEEVIEE